jgi:hypothetical protein
LIKTLHLEKNGPEKRDYDREPVIILQRIDLVRNLDRDRAMETQGVGNEHCDCEQQPIDDLEDLRA